MGEQGAGLGVAVQHRIGAGVLNDLQMQKGFSTGTPMALQHLCCLIHHDQIGLSDQSLVHTAGGHEQLQWLPLQHAAEIAPGAIAPASAVHIGDDGHQLPVQL